VLNVCNFSNSNFKLILAIAFLFISTLCAAQTVTLTASNYNGYNINCFGYQTGSITATVTGGTPPYTYRWSNNATTAALNNIPAGYYYVEVDDADSLTDVVIEEITLTQPEPLNMGEMLPYKYLNGFNVSAYGACNGSITTIIEGGVLPYTYQWEPGQQTVLSPTNLCANENVLIVTDANGCQINQGISLSEPERDDWTMNGNHNSNPATQFIGTSDNKDFVLKTNAIERARIKANGDFKINRILTNRIVSTDTLIYFGDSTIILHPNYNRIYGDPAGTGGGTAIGRYAWVWSPYSTSIGYFTYTNAPQSISLGYHLNTEAGADRSIIIGSGLQNGTKFKTNLPDRILMGTNSNVPTFLITPASGSNSTGKVGIATGSSEPLDKLQIEKGIYKIVMGNISSSASYGGMLTYIGFNAGRNNGTWTFNGNTGENGGSAIVGLTNGGMNFLTKPTSSGNDETKTDADLTGLVRMTIGKTGKVGIGTIPPNHGSAYLLYVSGGIATRDVKVTANPNWPDYVFEKDYSLMSIYELEQYIKHNKHLPEIPSAKEIEKNEGYEIGDMVAKLVKKNEELTLYIIEQQKQIDELKVVVNRKK